MKNTRRSKLATQVTKIWPEIFQSYIFRPSARKYVHTVTLVPGWKFHSRHPHHAVRQSTSTGITSEVVRCSCDKCLHSPQRETTGIAVAAAMEWYIHWPQWTREELLQALLNEKPHLLGHLTEEELVFLDLLLENPKATWADFQALKGN